VAVDGPPVAVGGEPVAIRGGSLAVGREPVAVRGGSLAVAGGSDADAAVPAVSRQVPIVSNLESPVVSTVQTSAPQESKATSVADRRLSKWFGA
jgi:hypothetical protein